jgi:hypothetical protein
MKQICKKTTNIDYYFFLPSMNRFRFMEIKYNYQLLCLTCLSGLLIPIFYIPCHFQSLCTCKTSWSNHLLQIFVFFHLWYYIHFNMVWCQWPLSKIEILPSLIFSITKPHVLHSNVWSTTIWHNIQQCKC